VEADADQIKRVLLNVINNALEAMGEKGGTLRLSTRRERDGVLILVEDDGPGVPAELREAIFEPFRQGPTASPHAPGTGIGLSLVGRFAELHGGRAWVQEREGGGASFRVFIPDLSQPELDESPTDVPVLHR